MTKPTHEQAIDLTPAQRTAAAAILHAFGVTAIALSLYYPVRDEPRIRVEVEDAESGEVRVVVA